MVPLPSSNTISRGVLPSKIRRGNSFPSGGPRHRNRKSNLSSFPRCWSASFGVAQWFFLSQPFRGLIPVSPLQVPFPEHSAMSCGGQSLTSPLLPTDGDAAGAYTSLGGDVDECRRLCFAASVYNISQPPENACRGFEYDYSTHKCRWKTTTPAAELSMTASPAAGNKQSCFKLAFFDTPYEYAHVTSYTETSGAGCEESSTVENLGQLQLGNGTLVGQEGADGAYIPRGSLEECKNLCLLGRERAYPRIGYVSDRSGFKPVSDQCPVGHAQSMSQSSVLLDA